ncbi:MAG: hypothetical protein HY329_20775 [Chloroflexi bacterium]|nr:hypothetical protein [Chloroflexota bacterium]
MSDEDVASFPDRNSRTPGAEKGIYSTMAGLLWGMIVLLVIAWGLGLAVNVGMWVNILLGLALIGFIFQLIVRPLLLARAADLTEAPVVVHQPRATTIVEEPVAVVDRDVLTQPVVDQPVVTQRVADEPILTQRVVEQPVHTQEVVERTVVADSDMPAQAVTEHVIQDAPAVQRTVVADQPVVERQVLRAPSSDTEEIVIRETPRP